MAAEYSRELGVKIHAGQCRSVRSGFRLGGTPSYCLRRELIDATGRSKGILEIGQRKYLQSDRVLLRAGPPEELNVVRSIFSQFVLEKKSQVRIARDLNRKGIACVGGRKWGQFTVHYVLKNENYIGNLLYNRTSGRLGQPRRVNPRDLWIKVEHAFDPIVEPSLFFQAQDRFANLYRHMSNEEMLKRLRIVLARKGRLSARVMNKTLGMPSTSLYNWRFGSLRNAYKLIGYEPKRKFDYLDTRRERAAMVAELASRIAGKIEASGGTAQFDENIGTLLINRNFNVSLRIARCQRRSGDGFLIWTIFHHACLPPGWIFAARLTETNNAILDYFLLPSTAMTRQKLRVSEWMVRVREYGVCRFRSFEGAVRPSRVAMHHG